MFWRDEEEFDLWAPLPVECLSGQFGWGEPVLDHRVGVDDYASEGTLLTPRLVESPEFDRGRARCAVAIELDPGAAGPGSPKHAGHPDNVVQITDLYLLNRRHRVPEALKARPNCEFSLARSLRRVG
jgi:hypothetical protein